MDDYHEFWKDHAIEIEEWRQHWFPSYVSIIHGGVASCGTTTPSTPSTSTQVVPPPPFNHVTKFFLKLKKNYQGVKTEKLRSLQEFERKTSESFRKAYTCMQRLITVTQGGDGGSSSPILVWDSGQGAATENTRCDSHE
jgi:hypothetical protein